MRRKLRRHLAFLMAVLMMLSLMGVQVLAEGVQVEAVQTTEGTDCTVLPEETDAEETSRSEMQCRYDCNINTMADNEKQLVYNERQYSHYHRRQKRDTECFYYFLFET